MTAASPWLLDRDDVRRFEDVIFDAPASLMRATVDRVPANPDGYAFLDRGGVRASLTTNPYARGFCSATGATGCPADELEGLSRFFESSGIRPRVHVPPDGLDGNRAQLLAGLGLVQTGFHTVLYGPTDDPDDRPVNATDSPAIAIEEVRDADRYEDFLTVQIRGWGVPDWAMDNLKGLCRPWRTAAGHRSYLATVDGEPAAHAMMFDAGDVAYLSSANTLPAFRRRGLQSALIRRRIADARSAGRGTVVGAADFGSDSHHNMVRCGLRVAYTAGWWERPE